MAPAGLGIALHQDIVGAIQKHQPGIDIAARQNAAHRGFHRRRVEVPCPHIDPQRQRPVALDFLRDQPVQHGKRQIVDDREADILEGRQRGRFAGARKAGDQRQNARPGRLIGPRRLSSIVGRHDHGPKRYTLPALSLRDGSPRYRREYAAGRGRQQSRIRAADTGSPGSARSSGTDTPSSVR